jgi:hypothetical protein
MPPESESSEKKPFDLFAALVVCSVIALVGSGVLAVVCFQDLGLADFGLKAFHWEPEAPEPEPRRAPPVRRKAKTPEEPERPETGGGPTFGAPAKDRSDKEPALGTVPPAKEPAEEPGGEAPAVVPPVEPVE